MRPGDSPPNPCRQPGRPAPRALEQGLGGCVGIGVGGAHIHTVLRSSRRRAGGRAELRCPAECRARVQAAAFARPAVRTAGLAALGLVCLSRGAGHARARPALPMGHKSYLEAEAGLWRPQEHACGHERAPETFSSGSSEPPGPCPAWLAHAQWGLSGTWGGGDGVGWRQGPLPQAAGVTHWSPAGGAPRAEIRG